MIEAHEKTAWEIETLRQSIDRDWAELATKDLSAERRRRITEHLAISNQALKDVFNRQRSEQNQTDDAVSLVPPHSQE